jgi:hypothetical protein
MLRWEWFRIYFESGIAKLASGDVRGEISRRWTTTTRMVHCPRGPAGTCSSAHWFHALTVVVTLCRVELVLVWAVFLPRRFRVACCVVVTALQLGIIATANYAFLNYLVLVLGVLLLDDEVLARMRLKTTASLALPTRWPDYLQYAVLAWVLYATVAALSPSAARTPLGAPRACAPFRIANQYGLFRQHDRSAMTRLSFREAETVA